MASYIDALLDASAWNIVELLQNRDKISLAVSEALTARGFLEIKHYKYRNLKSNAYYALTKKGENYIRLSKNWGERKEPVVPEKAPRVAKAKTDKVPGLRGRPRKDGSAPMQWRKMSEAERAALKIKTPGERKARKDTPKTLFEALDTYFGDIKKYEEFASEAVEKGFVTKVSIPALGGRGRPSTLYMKTQAGHEFVRSEKEKMSEAA